MKLKRQNCAGSCCSSFLPGSDISSQPLVRPPVCTTSALIKVHLEVLHFCSFPLRNSDLFSRPNLIYPLCSPWKDKWVQVGLDKVAELESIRTGSVLRSHHSFGQQAFTECLLGAWRLPIAEDTAGNRTSKVPAFVVVRATTKPQGPFQLEGCDRIERKCLWISPFATLLF